MILTWGVGNAGGLLEVLGWFSNSFYMMIQIYKYEIYAPIFESFQWAKF